MSTMNLTFAQALVPILILTLTLILPSHALHSQAASCQSRPALQSLLCSVACARVRTKDRVAGVASAAQNSDGVPSANLRRGWLTGQPTMPAVHSAAEINPAQPRLSTSSALGLQQ